MTLKIVPTVLTGDIDEFHKRLARLIPFANDIHIDVGDGKFVPTQTIPMHLMPDVSRWPEKEFEVHLMVERPGAYIQPMAQRGFRRVIFHTEVADEEMVKNLLAQCKEYNMTPVIAINPETPVESLLKYTDAVEEYAFMGGHPGFNGAPYLHETPTRVHTFLEKAKKKLIIQIDIGMTPETVGDVVRAGALRINSGSYISNASDPKKAYEELKRTAEQARVGK
jgi:ribulose-phosphate 3-epimerase